MSMVTMPIQHQQALLTTYGQEVERFLNTWNVMDAQAYEQFVTHLYYQHMSLKQRGGNGPSYPSHLAPGMVYPIPFAHPQMASAQNVSVGTEGMAANFAPPAFVHPQHYGLMAPSFGAESYGSPAMHNLPFQPPLFSNAAPRNFPPLFPQNLQPSPPIFPSSHSTYPGIEERRSSTFGPASQLARPSNYHSAPHVSSSSALTVANTLPSHIWEVQSDTQSESQSKRIVLRRETPEPGEEIEDVTFIEEVPPESRPLTQQQNAAELLTKDTVQSPMKDTVQSPIKSKDQREGLTQDFIAPTERGEDREERIEEKVIDKQDTTALLAGAMFKRFGSKQLSEGEKHFLASIVALHHQERFQTQPSLFVHLFERLVDLYHTRPENAIQSVKLLGDMAVESTQNEYLSVVDSDPAVLTRKEPLRRAKRFNTLNYQEFLLDVSDDENASNLTSVRPSVEDLYNESINELRDKIRLKLMERGRKSTQTEQFKVFDAVMEGHPVDEAVAAVKKEGMHEAAQQEKSSRPVAEIEAIDQTLDELFDSLEAEKEHKEHKEGAFTGHQGKEKRLDSDSTEETMEEKKRPSVNKHEALNQDEKVDDHETEVARLDNQEKARLAALKVQLQAQNVQVASSTQTLQAKTAMRKDVEARSLAILRTESENSRKVSLLRQQLEAAERDLSLCKEQRAFATGEVTALSKEIEMETRVLLALQSGVQKTTTSIQTLCGDKRHHESPEVVTKSKRKRVDESIEKYSGRSNQPELRESSTDSRQPDQMDFCKESDREKRLEKESRLKASLALTQRIHRSRLEEKEEGEEDEEGKRASDGGQQGGEYLDEDKMSDTNQEHGLDISETSSVILQTGSASRDEKMRENELTSKTNLKRDEDMEDSISNSDQTMENKVLQQVEHIDEESKSQTIESDAQAADAKRSKSTESKSKVPSMKGKIVHHFANDGLILHARDLHQFLHSASYPLAFLKKHYLGYILQKESEGDVGAKKWLDMHQKELDKQNTANLSTEKDGEDQPSTEKKLEAQPPAEKTQVLTERKTMNQIEKKTMDQTEKKTMDQTERNASRPSQHEKESKVQPSKDHLSIQSVDRNKESVTNQQREQQKDQQQKADKKEADQMKEQNQQIAPILKEQKTAQQEKSQNEETCEMNLKQQKEQNGNMEVEYPDPYPDPHPDTARQSNVLPIDEKADMSLPSTAKPAKEVNSTIQGTKSRDETTRDQHIEEIESVKEKEQTVHDDLKVNKEQSTSRKGISLPEEVESSSKPSTASSSPSKSVMSSCSWTRDLFNPSHQVVLSPASFDGCFRWEDFPSPSAFIRTSKYILKGLRSSLTHSPPVEARFSEPCLCPTELSGGRCRDRACDYSHFDALLKRKGAERRRDIANTEDEFCTSLLQSIPRPDKRSRHKELQALWHPNTNSERYFSKDSSSPEAKALSFLKKLFPRGWQGSTHGGLDQSLAHLTNALQTDRTNEELWILHLELLARHQKTTLQSLKEGYLSALKQLPGSKRLFWSYLDMSDKKSRPNLVKDRLVALLKAEGEFDSREAYHLLMQWAILHPPIHARDLFRQILFDVTSKESTKETDRQGQFETLFGEESNRKIKELQSDYKALIFVAYSTLCVQDVQSMTWPMNLFGETSYGLMATEQLLVLPGHLQVHPRLSAEMVHLLSTETFSVKKKRCLLASLRPVLDEKAQMALANTAVQVGTESKNQVDLQSGTKTGSMRVLLVDSALQKELEGVIARVSALPNNQLSLQWTEEIFSKLLARFTNSFEQQVLWTELLLIFKIVAPQHFEVFFKSKIGQIASGCCLNTFALPFVQDAYHTSAILNNVQTLLNFGMEKR